MIAELGEKDGSMVLVKDGRFGVYINWNKINAKLPAEYADNPETLPLEEAWALIEEKADNAKPGRKSKKSAQVELPPAPKRPLSAYLHFCAEKRPEVAEKATSLGEISKELSRLWAETSDRSPYEDMAAAGKAEYEEQKREWQKKCQELLEKSSSASTKKRNGRKENAGARINGASSPKRPKSAYLFFCMEKRPEVSKARVKSIGDISKELARLWAETAENEEGRKKYQDMAAADKKRYEQELMKLGLVNGKETTVNGKVATPRSKATKKRPATSKKQSGSKKTSTRAPSAYMLFCSENRNNIVDDQGEKLPFGATAKKLAAMWRLADKETKAHFQNQADEEKKKLLQSTTS